VKICFTPCHMPTPRISIYSIKQFLLNLVNSQENYIIITIVVTKCQVLWLKCTKLYFGWGSARHRWGAYSAIPVFLSEFKRPASKGREGERREGRSLLYIFCRLQPWYNVCVCVSVYLRSRHWIRSLQQYH